MPSLRNLARVVSCAAFAVASTGAFAQGFAALVSPPRFELVGKPGDKIRDVVEITNAGAQPANGLHETCSPCPAMEARPGWK